MMAKKPPMADPIRDAVAEIVRECIAEQRAQIVEEILAGIRTPVCPSRLTVDEANKRTRAPSHEIRAAIKRGELRAAREPFPGPHGFRHLIHISDLDAWCERRARQYAETEAS